METLFSITQPAPTAPEPVADDKRKRPGVAFGLSLLVPGLGHFYCGKARTAFVTMAFAVGTLACVLLLSPNTAPLVWGVALRAFIVLYMFGFLDAFYTAREINAGLEPYMVGNNPRIAAVLNLLTNGFGYFYLGERKKGLIMFFALRIFASTATRAGGQQGKVMMVIAEIVFVVIALDAYRIARKQLKDIFPESLTDPLATAPNGELSAAAPIALAAIFVFNYAAMVTLGLALPDYKQLDRSRAVVTTNTAHEQVYSNPAYGIEFRVPESWELLRNEPDEMVGARKFEGACRVQFMPIANTPWRGVKYDSQQVAGSLLKANRNFYLQSEKPTTLGGRPAYEIAFVAKVGDADVQQRYVFAQRRLTMYMFISTAASVAMDECAREMDTIRETLKVP